MHLKCEVFETRPRFWNVIQYKSSKC